MVDRGGPQNCGPTAQQTLSHSSRFLLPRGAASSQPQQQRDHSVTRGHLWSRGPAIACCYQEQVCSLLPDTLTKTPGSAHANLSCIGRMLQLVEPLCLDLPDAAAICVGKLRSASHDHVSHSQSATLYTWYAASLTGQNDMPHLLPPGPQAHAA